MMVLPLLGRELRSRARSRGTYWTRSAIALVGVFIAFTALVASGPFGTSSTLGRNVFDGVVGAAFLLSCSACLLTADVISAERREGTLGLLFLTRVRSFDVLLGKFGSMGMTSLCALLVFLPVLMLPVLVGGVTGGEAVRKSLALLSTLAFALAVGLFASASHRDRFNAGRQTVLLFALLLLLPAWLVGMWGPWGALPARNRSTLVGLLSPIFLLYYAGDGRYQSAPGAYWFSLAAVSGIGALLLARAATRLSSSVAEARLDLAEADSPVHGGVGAPLEPARGPAFAAGVSPVVWLMSRQRGLKAALWSAALIGLVFQTGFIPFFFSAGILRFWLYVSTVPALAMSALSGALIAWAASRFFVGARRTGELELLITTPLGAETIVLDQWHLLKNLLAAPVLVMLAPVFLRMVPLVMGGGPWVVNFSPALVYQPATLFLSLVNIVLAVCSLCWLGLWFGLRAKGQASAILWTIGLGTAIPFLWNLICSMLFVPLFRPYGPGGPFAFIRWLPQLISSFYYLGLISIAKRHLIRELSDPQPTELNPRDFFVTTAREIASLLRRARWWSPH
jgi:hypothetical protein